jgi:hypothetical protein
MTGFRPSELVGGLNFFCKSLFLKNKETPIGVNNFFAKGISGINFWKSRILG